MRKYWDWGPIHLGSTTAPYLIHALIFVCGAAFLPSMPSLLSPSFLSYQGSRSSFSILSCSKQQRQLSSYSVYAMGWTIQGSLPCRSRYFSHLLNVRAGRETNHISRPGGTRCCFYRGQKARAWSWQCTSNECRLGWIELYPYSLYAFMACTGTSLALHQWSPIVEFINSSKYRSSSPRNF